MKQQMNAVLWMEILKVRRSKVFSISIYFFLFIGIMMGMMEFLVMHPEIANRSSTVSMKTSFLAGSDWNAYFNLLLQLILTVGVIGFGIITSWVFGREFMDKVFKDLIVLPVPRYKIILSKFIVLFGWSVILTVTVLAGSVLTGLLIGLHGWDTGAFLEFLETFLICSVLNIFLITPVAFIACAGRGYMLPVVFVILIMILTQFIFLTVPAFSIWFPWALPALISHVAGPLMPPAGVISYLSYGIIVIAGLFGTLWWWKSRDHH